MYNAGAALAAQEVFEVDPAVTCLTARDFLLYSYYCGLIHIGVSSFNLFHLSLPSHAFPSQPFSIPL